MASKKIRGITVEIGGDVSGLNKALESTNKQVKSTQTQLKDVQRLLKLDPSNTELLRQNQQLLGQAVAETGQKLDQLKKLEQQLKDSGVEENSAQFMAVRREIISTTAEMESLEKAALSASATMSHIASVADQVSSGAQKVADKTRALSTAAAAGLSGIAGLGYKAITAADDLNTLSKQSGISTADLQKLQYAADLIDVDPDSVIGSLSKLKKNMVSTSKDTVAAFERIGVSTTDANDQLRNSTEVFYEALAGLASISNETERDTVAMQLFGKSADQLAGLIDDGGKQFRELGDEAERLGYILDQDTLDSLDGVNGKLDQLKMKASGDLATSGAKAIEALTPELERVIEFIDGILTKLGELSPEQIRTITLILGIVAAISPVASIIAKVSGGVSTVIGLLGKLGPMISTVTTFLGGLFSKVAAFAAANPIVLIIAAIVALVALIATKGDEIQAILQKVDDFLQNIFATDFTKIFGPVLGEALNMFFANVKNVWDSIKKIFDGIIDFVRGVFTGDWGLAWNGIKEIFSGVFSGLTAIAKAPLNAIIGLINGLISGINWLIRKLNGIRITPPKWVTSLTGIGSFGFNLSELGKIPYLANGGILSRGSAVVGEAGPELLTMAGGSAVVQPLTNQTTHHRSTYLGGMTVNVYAAPGQDVEELADVVLERAQQKYDEEAIALA